MLNHCFLSFSAVLYVRFRSILTRCLCLHMMTISLLSWKSMIPMVSRRKNFRSTLSQWAVPTITTGSMSTLSLLPKKDLKLTFRTFVQCESYFHLLLYLSTIHISHICKHLPFLGGVCFNLQLTILICQV